MFSRLKSSWWPSAVGFVLAVLVLADLMVLNGPLRALWLRHRAGGAAAEAAGTTITRREVEEALRDHLWKQHESWATLDLDTRTQRRHTVLENLVNVRLVRSARLRDPAFNLTATEVRREMEMQQRQFATPLNYRQRLAAQGHTPHSLQEAVRAAQLDQQWLQAQIDLRMPKVSEAELRSWHEQSKEKLRVPQAHHAAHIFLTRHGRSRQDRESEMWEIHRKLATKQQSFAALAVRHSEDERTKSIGGDLGWFTRERMPADFMAAVERLPVGKFSEPISTRLGWHLVIVLERRESRLPGFEEAREEISALLDGWRREAALEKIITGLRNAATSSVKYHAEIIDRVEPAP